jgi:UDP-N-acetyl-D-galactosamine dehydrogenase
MLGLTFKENIPDLRNSKVADLVATLASLGHTVTVRDCHADKAEAAHEYSIALSENALEGRYDMVVLAVAHTEYLALGGEALRAMLTHGGTLADLKGQLGTAADWTL